MSKLLFTHSYFLRFDPKQWKLGQPYAPLGTLYAASFMRSRGYEVGFHDVQFDENPETITASLNDEQPRYFVIYDDGFNYLTKMCLTNMRDAAFKMIGIAHEYGAKIIVSSSDATDHYSEYLAAGADVVLIGEGEQSLLEVVNAFENADELRSISGIAFKSSGGIVKTTSRPVMKDLDSLPLPAWDLVDLEPYRKMWFNSAGYFSINIGTTRGCPFKCNWCAKPIYGNRYHSRSPQHVVNEIKLLKQKTSFEHIWFCDDIFGLKPGWVQQFADLVENEELHFSFKIQSRADLLLQPSYVEALARAGCKQVWMGAESGSQKILDAMDKGITVDDIRKATLLLKKYKIKPSFFIQFGYLGEEMEDIEQTISLINELLPEDIGVSVSYPLPGTKFYDKVKQDLVSKANWTDSDDLDLMFNNTYSAEFYKILHRYVHKNYRKYQAIDGLKNIFGKTIHSVTPSFRRSIALPYYTYGAWKYKNQLKKHSAIR
jgi:radical SAM superfamily enzyme YgiQ (UPF0313 family)